MLVLVVMASALERMLLYQREYGLTELRIYATGVILWLGVVFVWLGVDRAARPPARLRPGAVLAGFVATLALNAVNPDALIARTNLARPHVDTAYLGNLSDDAVPALLERLPALDPIAAPPARGRAPGAPRVRRRHARAGTPPGREPSSLLAEHRAELKAYAAKRQAVEPSPRLNCPATGAVSSVGRAPARQAGGHWFEPSTAHRKSPVNRAFLLPEQGAAGKAVARIDTRTGHVCSWESVGA